MCVVCLAKMTTIRIASLMLGGMLSQLAAMPTLFLKFLRIHWFLAILAIMLGCVGVYAVYAATWMREVDFWNRQAVFLAVGVPIMLVIALVDYRWIRWGAVPFYVVSVVLLVLVRVMGRETYGAKSWLDLGFISLQPAQLAIVSGILTVAVFLEATSRLHAMLRLMGVGVIIAVPCFLILTQPDLGSTIVWFPVVMAMLFVGGIPKRYLAAMLLVVVAAIPVVANFGIKPYQKARITAFLDPNADPLGAGWTINQSLIAVGSGGIEGKGFKAQNTLTELGFLPSTISHNDFVFAVFAEHHGFIGGVLLISAFACLLMMGLQVALLARDPMGRIIAAGIIAELFTYTFMNIGMTISLTPVTGLPLPFISYGGTFLLTTLASIGLLQSIWVHRKTLA